MAEVGRMFVSASRETLAKWLGRIETCLGQLTTEQIWWRGQDNSNAIGNLVLHVAGNMRQWIISGVGGAPDTRDRAAEFACREPLDAAELLARLKVAVAEADAVLARLSDEDLRARRQIQAHYDVSVLEAIHHVTEHFSLHAGQIVYATKLLTGKDLAFYRYLQQRQPAPPPGQARP